MENITNQEQGENKLPTPQHTEEKKAGEKNITMAVVAYILFFAPLLTNSKDDSFVKYHVKQGFLLFVTWLAIYIVMGVLSGSFFISFAFLSLFSFLTTILHIGLFILLIIGIIHASHGEEKPLPLIGQFADKVPF